MQTILGSNGVIGKNLAQNLRKSGHSLRLVGRNPVKADDHDQIFQADLTRKDQVMKAIEGSDITYLTAGIPYDIRIWSVVWPEIMDNVIEACKKHQSKLVFFDNVYALGLVKGPITEESPINPCSRKGEVRASITQRLLDEIRKGNLTALIARAPDFYGPDTYTSFINLMVIEKLAKGKKAQLLGSDSKVHTYIYTPDAGEATAMLGNTETAYNQIWNLPSDAEPLTGKQWVEIAAEYLGVSARYQVLGRGMLGMAGFFSRVIKESVEMLYQFEHDYRFDSSKFQNAFRYVPTGYREGIGNTADFLMNTIKAR